MRPPELHKTGSDFLLQGRSTLISRDWNFWFSSVAYLVSNLGAHEFCNVYSNTFLVTVYNSLNCLQHSRLNNNVSNPVSCVELCQSPYNVYLYSFNRRSLFIRVVRHSQHIYCLRLPTYDSLGVSTRCGCARCSCVM